MAGPMPPVPGVIQVNIQGSIPGEIWENVLHFAYSGPTPTAATLTTWAQGIAQAWSNYITPLQPPQVTLTQVAVIDIASTSGAEGVFTAGYVGTRAGADIGANSALLFSYQAPTRWRGGKFRTYLLCGVAQDLQNPMSWLATFETNALTSWKNFLTNSVGQISGGSQITQVVGVRRHGKYLPNGGPPNFVLNTPIAYPLVISAITSHTQLASQKGRIGRRSK